MTAPVSVSGLRHTLRRMTGRDPSENHRVSTPLELLYDLTFVVAFSFSASQFAQKLAEGHVGESVLGFVIAAWGICWAWVQFSWFASAYDTDDWGMRLGVLVQMVGVLVLALGTPRLFGTIGEPHVDTTMMVFGYVIMRLALVALWLRAARSDPRHRGTCLGSAAFVTVAQIGWVVVALVHLPRVVLIPLLIVGLALEMVGPVVVQRVYGDLPWHAHHLAERFGLLVIICLGEGIAASVASLSTFVEEGWSLESASLVAAGVGLTFGMWWMYFVLPSADLLAAHRERMRTFSYVHMVIFAAIVATGGGLEVAVEVLEEKSHLSALAVTLAVAVPVLVYVALVYVIFDLMAGGWDALHTWLGLASVAVAALAVALAAAGVAPSITLLIVTAVPVVTIVGYELWGHRRIGEIVRELDAP